MSTKKVEINVGDRRFKSTLKILAFSILVLLVLIAVQVGGLGWQALSHFGFNFIFSQNWDPSAENFGALAFLYGTLVSSAIALFFAVPIGVGSALFLSEYTRGALARGLALLIEMLAAIPSVVYGLWGVFVLAPFLRERVEPFLLKYFGWSPLFQGPCYGVGMLAGGLILAIMITPTISAVCREVFKAVPVMQREAALGLGATRWESIRIGVLKSSGSGILGAVILGLGRALGETMAITMVIGNRSEISKSLFAPGQTMSSIIANEYAEASPGLHLSSLAAIGLVLLFVSLTINLIARLLVWRGKRAVAR